MTGKYLYDENTHEIYEKIPGQPYSAMVPLLVSCPLEHCNWSGTWGEVFKATMSSELKLGDENVCPGCKVDWPIDVIPPDHEDITEIEDGRTRRHLISDLLN